MSRRRHTDQRTQDIGSLVDQIGKVKDELNKLYSSIAHMSVDKAIEASDRINVLEIKKSSLRNRLRLLQDWHYRMNQVGCDLYPLRANNRIPV